MPDLGPLPPSATLVYKTIECHDDALIELDDGADVLDGFGEHSDLDLEEDR